MTMSLIVSALRAVDPTDLVLPQATSAAIMAAVIPIADVIDNRLMCTPLV
jgi:hypothetical protein